ncbi:hypothetical protein [Halopiger djelfimassiliensis]|uniref:hypothetical protein n=1 Tax=Halopiger djelfimassiliensis TaxID=1293047 RepID=UPI000A5D2D59|nr:hypothetical protein [Halopiger djelfimassiliensis]
MTHSDTSSDSEFTVGRNRYGDGWRIDEEGCLHMGVATPFVEHITTAHNGSQ